MHRYLAHDMQKRQALRFLLLRGSVIQHLGCLTASCVAVPTALPTLSRSAIAKNAPATSPHVLHNFVRA